MASTAQVSSATLSSLRDRVEQFLSDTANAKFATGLIDEGIALALQEYTNLFPLENISTFTPAVNKREFELTTSGILRVVRVQFPYTVADPEYPISFVRFETYKNAGVFSVWLDVENAPDGTDVARYWYHSMHTLNGLNSASATTFPANLDWLFVLGAAGHALYGRAIANSETVDVRTESTPNQIVVGQRLLREFRFQLQLLPRG
jgi:hypothetical protein